MLLRRANHRIPILPLLFLIILNLSFRAECEQSGPRGEIRVVESWRPDINVLGHNVLQYLFEYALDRNKLAPSLAVSKTWIDDTTLEIHLRQGVRFHNGEPFDADAVKFNFDYQRRHNQGRGIQVYMKKVKEIQVVDHYIVRLMLDQPDSLLLDKIAIGPIAGWTMGAPEYMRQVGWEEFLKRPVGTGPYMVEGEIKDYRELSQGETYATLVANAHYWQKSHPKISKIMFIRYSPKAAVRAVMEGRVDLATSLVAKDAWKVDKSRLSKVVRGTEDVTFTSAQFNLKSPHTAPLYDLRVRKALNYAINKKELMRYAYKGNAVEMRGALTAKAGVDLTDTEAYSWDIPKARELLKEAGYAGGFRMPLYYQEKNFLIAQFLQRFYSLLNIDVEITPVEWEWIVNHIVYPNTRDDYSWKDEDWWIILYSNPGYVPELMGGQLEWSYHLDAPWRSIPDSMLEPLDEMYQEVLRTKNPERRFEIYKKANGYIADQALQVFTMSPLSLYGVNEEVNFVPQVSQYLYLDYSSVTDSHWSIRGENN